MKFNEYSSALSKYLPEGTAEEVTKIIFNHPVKLKITKSRDSKLGDFRPERKGGHVITINHNLKPLQFLTTLIHELAHLAVYIEHGLSVAPHGKEWKLAFKTLYDPILALEVLPEEIVPALQRYLANPGATTASSHQLQTAFDQYYQVDKVTVNDLDEGIIFALTNGRVFKKGKKRRTRHECVDLKNKRIYLVSGIAEAKIIETK